MFSKKEIREKILKDLEKNFDKKGEERLIIGKIFHNKIFKKSKNIGIFFPIKNEINILKLLKIKNKSFFLPKIIGENIYFGEFLDKKFLKKGKFGIFEPEKISEKKLDLIIVPGLAFTKSGKRIGWGKGFYDKFFSKNTIYTIGACFDFQVFEDFEQEDFDKKVDEIIF